MADDLAKQLSSRKLKVVVLDFSPPNIHSAPFGAYLADEFSAALSKEAGTLTVVDRTQVKTALSSLRLQPDDQLNYSNDKRIAAKVGRPLCDCRQLC
jgi:2-polyprenyl-6-methoxyphenol hydroxylase-like FAD-dependent oxidoreductase